MRAAKIAELTRLLDAVLEVHRCTTGCCGVTAILLIVGAALCAGFVRKRFEYHITRL